MKIAISQIAWQVSEEETIASRLQQFEIHGVEIAPTKIWPSPPMATESEIKAYRQFWQHYGINIVAMQALLYGRPDLKIFINYETRQQTFNYLAEIIDLAAQLGASRLVFGAPKNRSMGNLDPKVAWDIALEFFGGLGHLAAQRGVIFCIEPNPSQYHCDFITTSQEGLALVQAVNSPGLGLHLDAAAMTLSQEPVESALKQALPQLCHFHVSEPNLAPIGQGTVNHEKFGAALKQLNYQGWCSVEMRGSDTADNIPQITPALETAIGYYR